MKRAKVMIVIALLVGVVLAGGCIGGSKKSGGNPKQSAVVSTQLSEIKGVSFATVNLTVTVTNYDGKVRPTLVLRLNDGKVIRVEGEVVSANLGGGNTEYTISFKIAPKENVVGSGTATLELALDNGRTLTSNLGTVSVSIYKDFEVEASFQNGRTISLTPYSNGKVTLYLTIHSTIPSNILVTDAEIKPDVGSIEVPKEITVSGRKTVPITVKIDRDKIKTGDSVTISIKGTAQAVGFNLKRGFAVEKTFTVTFEGFGISEDELLNVNVENAWYDRSSGVVVLLILFPMTNVKESYYNVSVLYGGEKIGAIYLDGEDINATPVKVFNDSMSVAPRLSYSMRVNATKNWLFVVTKLKPNETLEELRSEPLELDITLVKAVNMLGEERVFNAEKKVPVKIESITDLSVVAPFSLSRVCVEPLESYFYVKNGTSVYAVRLVANYLGIPTNNATVNLKFSTEAGKVVVLDSALTYDSFIYLLNSGSNYPDNVYFDVSRNRISKEVFLYVVSKDANPRNITVEYVASTKGSNGKEKKGSFTISPEVVEAFPYLGFSYPASEYASELGGYTLTPFDRTEISWYKGLEALYSYGIPDGFTKKYDVPIVFITPKKGNYYLKALAPDVSGGFAKMTPLEILFNRTIAYVGYVKMPAYVGTLLPVEFIIYRDGKPVYLERTYFNPTILPYLKGTRPDIVASYLVDNFVSSVAGTYLTEFYSLLYFNTTNVTKIYKTLGYKPPIIVNGTEVYFDRNGTPVYGLKPVRMLLADKGDHYEVNLESIPVKEVGDVFKLDRVCEIPGSFEAEKKIRGDEIFLNPKFIPYVTLNPGDDRRIFGVAVDTIPCRLNAKELVSLSGYFPDVYSYADYYGTYVAVSNYGNKDVEVVVNGKTSEVSAFSIRTFRITGNTTVSVGGKTFAFELPKPVKIDPDEYNVAGYSLLDSNGTLPFYEVKFYADTPIMPDRNSLKVVVSSGGKDYTATLSDFESILAGFFTLTTSDKPMFALKTYNTGYVIDVYIPKKLVSGDVTIRIYADGKETEATFSESELKTLGMISFLDAGVLPDFGLYFFDWLDFN